MPTVLDHLPVREPLSLADYSAAELSEDASTLYLMDQRRLPGALEYFAIDNVVDAAEGIRAMVVRGAPAIGITAAYAMVLAARAAPSNAEGFARSMAEDARLLRAARPTAVNLAWAVDRMIEASRAMESLDPASRVEALAEVARRIHRDDVAACKTMGELGAELVPDGAVMLTHCNAGALATGGYGTALGVLRSAWKKGRLRAVLADETRPYLQGARLTAWELHRDGIPVEIITDGMAGHLMARGEIHGAVVGADRIARNGDAANKIGTYGVAVLAREHGLPFLVAAPWSTVDLACESGASIPIEERSSDEVTHIGGHRIAPNGVRARHPAFDVTPARFIDAIVTERGVVRPRDGGMLSLLETGSRGQSLGSG